MCEALICGSCHNYRSPLFRTDCSKFRTEEEFKRSIQIEEGEFFFFFYVTDLNIDR